jgi:uncharacterized OB-fold protein
VTPLRPLPAITPLEEPFWRGGADGRLHLQRCGDCRTWIHPPLPRCPACLSEAVGPEASSGRGTVYSFTVNHQAWSPGLPDRYVVAVVELDDQPGLRVLSNVVDIDPDDVHIGLAVEVTFEAQGDVHFPLFRPYG